MNWIGLAWYVTRRLLAASVIILLVSVLVFGLLALSPGSPEQILLGNRPASPDAIAAIRARYHLDEPFLSQYLRWLSDAVRLDFGTSIRSSVPVIDELGQRLGVTAGLAAYSGLILVLIGVPAGLLAGARRGSLLDLLVTVGGVLGIGVPVFVTGILLLYLFAVGLGWFPTYGAGRGAFDTLHHLTLPAVTLASTQVAFVARQTRAAALNVFQTDYVIFARARGLAPGLIWTRFALRNSSLPVITSLGLVVASSLTGAVLVEKTFSLPGLGALLIDAVNDKDIPVVQGLSLLAALVFGVVNLGADLIILAIDPRLRKAVLG